jgi:parallel beta-helix repeat protein
MSGRKRSGVSWFALGMVLVSLVAVWGVGAGAVGSTATTWYVATTGTDGPAGTFPSAPLKTISQAITNANSGDIIMVGGGTYPEKLTIGKADLTLMPWDPSVVTIDGDGGTGAVVKITNTHGIKITGFTVTGSGSNPATDCGIGLQGAIGCTVENNTVEGNAAGIVLTAASTGNTIQNNTVHGNGYWGIVLYNNGVGTPTDPDNTGNTIFHNDITGNGGSGIYLDAHSDGNEIENNTITGSYQNPAFAAVVGQPIDASGIFFQKSDGNTVSGNTLSGNAEYGVDLHEGSEGNAFTGNTIGNTVNGGNTLGGVRVHLGAATLDSPNTLTGNTFTSNSPQVIDGSGLMVMEDVLHDNTFDKTVVVDAPTASLLHTIWSTIQPAVDAVDVSGAKISVSAGTYAEQVLVSGKTNLTIQGKGDTTIIEPAYVENTAAIMIKHADGLTIKDLKIHTSGNEQQGIWVRGANENNDLAVADLTIQNTTIVVEGGTGNEHSSGICVDSSTDAAHSGWLITGNRITAHGCAFSIQDVTDSTITDNILTLPGTDGATNTLWTSERHVLANLVFSHNTVSGSGGSMVSILTDYNEWAGVSFVESPALRGQINGVTFHGNIFGTWGSRAIRVGDAFGTTPGTVTGIGIDNNTFQMTVDVGTDVIGGTDAPSATGNTNVFNVSGTAKIQKAVNSAFSGDTVNVAAGTYSENVTVNKALTLTGAGSATTTVTAASAASSVFTVTASSVTISGFTVSGATGAGQAGIYLGAGVALCNIHDNILTGNYDGIWLGSGSNNNTLTNNTANSNTTQGFEVYLSSNNTFTNNVANSNTKYGFKIEAASNNTFTGNTANSNGQHGFYLATGPAAGSTGCNDNTFTNNTANANVSSGIRINGRYAGDSSHNTLTGNTLSGNAVGITIADAFIDVATMTVTNNCIAGNTTGVSNLGTGTLNASHNWWGNETGPGDVGPGSGDKVSTNVNYVPWHSACSGGTDIYPLDVSTVAPLLTNLVVGGDFAEFKIKVTNLAASGVTYDHLQLHMTITGPSALAADMFRLQSQGSWTDVVLAKVGDTVVGTYNLPAPVAPGGTPETTFRIKAQLSAPVGTAYTLTVELRDLEPNPAATRDSLTQTFSVGGGTTTASMTFGPGWNMVSVPVVGADNVPETVFHAVIDAGQSLVMYEWIAAGAGSYVAPTEIDPARGYWLYLWGSVTVGVTAPALTGDYSVTLGAAGWQQVSTPRWPIAWLSLKFTDGTTTKTFADAVTAGWLLPAAYWYNTGTSPAGYAGVDVATDPMEPWKAYWIYTNVAGLTMILPLDTPYVPPAVSSSALTFKALPEGLTPPLPPAAPRPLGVEAGALEFGNSPNPITDVNTTTFFVAGARAASVSAIKVQIFDLAGRLVFDREIDGTSLDWHTDSDYGEYLANGIYLYKMSALIDGRWVVSSTRKLAILR